MDCYRCGGKDSMTAITPKHYLCGRCGYEWRPARLTKLVCPTCYKPVVTMPDGRWRCPNNPATQPGACAKSVKPEDVKELPF